MDGHQFDTLTKTLTGPGSRRLALRALAALPLSGLLASLWGEEQSAAKGRQRRQHRHHQTRNAERKEAAAERKRKQKHKKMPACTGAGEAPRNSLGCCSGLVLDGAGVCTASQPSPPSPSPQTPCAGHCTGCCKGGTCRAGTGRAACGTGGVACAKCVAPTDTCFQGACACQVCAGGGCPFDSLEAAIGAAGTDDLITICPGRYSLSATLLIDESLILSGAGSGLDPQVDTIIDATGSNQTAVEIGPPHRVLLRNLTIRGGKGSSFAPNDVGGGIYSQGELILDNVLVTENTAQSGGGVFNHFHPLTLRAGARVTANTAAGGGGGIWTTAGNLVMESGSSVSGNAAGFGGGIVNQDGLTTLKGGSSVEANFAGSGGGIYNYIDATLTLESGSKVRGNGERSGDHPTILGGGIYNTLDGQVILQSDSHVEENEARDQGGGLYNDSNAPVTIATAEIIVNNTVDNCFSTTPVDNCTG